MDISSTTEPRRSNAAPGPTAMPPVLLTQVTQAREALGRIGVRLHSMCRSLHLMIDALENNGGNPDLVEAMFGINDTIEEQRAKLNRVEHMLQTAAQRVSSDLPVMPDTEKWSDKDWTITLVRDLRSSLNSLDFTLGALEDHSDADHEGQPIPKDSPAAT